MTIIEKMRLNMNEHMKAASKSQSDISRQLGISKSALSQYLSGKYTGDNEDIAERIKQYFKFEETRREFISPPPVSIEMRNTREILSKIAITHADNGIMLLSGAAGTGKTTAINYYCDTHTGVIHVEADVVTNSPRAILKAVLDAMGEQTAGNTSENMRRLISRLRGTNQLIIIDEAQHLTPKAFEALRAINDKAEIGIVYSGNPSIKKRIFDREEFDQVQSRIDYRLDVSNHYSAKDIERLFDGQNISADCLRALKARANKPGGLRVMIKEYKLARWLAKANSRELAIGDLEEAAVRMGVR